MITENDCGYSVEPDDASSFADALIHAADNRCDLPSMGLNAQALAKREFNRHDLADKWVNWVVGVKS